MSTIGGHRVRLERERSNIDNERELIHAKRCDLYISEILALNKSGYYVEI